MSDLGQILLAILPYLALLLWLVWITWVYFFKKGAPFYPTYKRHMEDMLRLANIQPTDRVVDIGCGDGRLVFAAAKCGAAQTVGYEISPLWRLVCALRQIISPLGKNVRFYWRSYWKENLNAFNVVLVYQCQRTMPFLAEKLKKELSSGSRIISNTFYFPDWPPAAQIGKVYLYIVEKNAAE
ncbi:MAG: class I SAM-dependent methyltransferase [bacterium]